MGIVDTLFNRKKQREHDIRLDVQSLARKVAEIDVCKAEGKKPPKLDTDLASEILEASRLSEAEFRAEVEKAKQQIKYKRLAPQVETLKKDAEEKRKAFEKADLAEGRRRQAAHDKLQQMRFTADRAEQAYLQAFSAKHELAASIPASPYEKELGKKARELAAQLRDVELALLSQNDGRATVVGELAEARAEVAKLRKSGNVEGVKRWESRERGFARQVEALEQRRDEIKSKLDAINAEAAAVRTPVEALLEASK